MKIETLIVGPLQVNCYVVWCPRSQEAVVIDAGDEADRILELIEREQLTVKALLNTHGHFDHQGAVGPLVAATQAPFRIHQDDLMLIERAEQHAAVYDLKTTAAPLPDSYLAAGDQVPFGEEVLEVRCTPGHSPGGVCFVGPGVVFSGDSLFAGSIGRTDLPMGDHEQLVTSIQQQLLTLPDETNVYPGHGPQTTIGREKLVNPFLR